MKLTNKVTNVFFALMAVVSLFMPIVGYSTLLTGDTFSLVDFINFLKDIDPNADTNLLSNLGEYGYRGLAIAVAVFFVLMLICLLLTLIFGFANVSYLARTIVTGLGFASYVAAVVCFLKIGNAFVSGAIPTTAITSLTAQGEGNFLTALISSFASITKMGIASGAYVGMISFGILLVVNLLFFIFRNKIAQADGDTKAPKKAKKAKKAKA
ncbi:MAG: hypothetical protein IJJ41_02610 [Clostridia bacterium]|nr:hypothetical protein [Clostridia bacterium]